jgi:septal ring factor EnvC (AmiA/AmiB activator)
LPPRHSLRRFIGSLLFALAALQPADARPASKGAASVTPSAAQVKELERQAAESRARAAALAAKTAKIEKDLEAQRQALTAAAAEVRTGEETLSRLEMEQASLAGTVGRRTEILEQERAKLSRMTAALVRLSRIPPGGLFAGFERPIDASRAEQLLQSAIVVTRDGAKRIEEELNRLDEARRQLADKRREGEQEAGVLKARQANLTGLVDKRQSLYQQTENDRQEEEEKAQKIAEQANDLRDLVARIEAQQKAEQEAEARRKARMKKAPPASSPGQLSGHFTVAKGLPVAGEVKIHFGQNDGLGTTSHGLTVIARPGAAVTAPSAGIVRFAGPFRSYREILILEHPGGYLSLIAGLSRVNAALGARVGAGEPIGTMDERANARPELYYELRRNGQFVDPEAVSLPVAVKGKAR